MTDTGPITVVDEIVVTGQRRSDPINPFPERPDPIEGPVNPGDETIETPDQFDPCDDPLAALAWNLDAAAAAAAQDMLATAAAQGDGSNFTNREFGTNLYRGPGGSLLHTPIDVGDPAVPGVIPSVSILRHQSTEETWMGDMHNHPSGDGRLSDGEWTDFINRVSAISAVYPHRRSELDIVSIYVVVADASTPDGYRIYAYARNTPFNVQGQEVNPDAQPCPSA